MGELRRRRGIVVLYWSSGSTNDGFPSWRTSNLPGDRRKSKSRLLQSVQIVLTRFIDNHLIPYVSPELYHTSGRTWVQGISLKLTRLHSILSHLWADSGWRFSGRKISTFENRSLANPNCDYLPTLEEESQLSNGIWTREGHSGESLGWNLWMNSWRRTSL